MLVSLAVLFGLKTRQLDLAQWLSYRFVGIFIICHPIARHDPAVHKWCSLCCIITSSSGTASAWEREVSNSACGGNGPSPSTLILCTPRHVQDWTEDYLPMILTQFAAARRTSIQALSGSIFSMLDRSNYHRRNGEHLTGDLNMFYGVRIETVEVNHDQWFRLRYPWELDTIRPNVLVFPLYSTLCLTKNVLAGLCGHWNDEGENCGEDMIYLRQRDVFPGPTKSPSSCHAELNILCIYKTRAGTEQHWYMIHVNDKRTSAFPREMDSQLVGEESLRS